MPQDPIDGFDPVAARQDIAAGEYTDVHLDGFVNVVTGLGDPAQDKSLGGRWGGPQFALTIVPAVEAEARYRGSDLGRVIVDAVPEEMCRRGWKVEIQPSDDDEARADAFGAASVQGIPPAPMLQPGVLPEIDNEGIEIAEAVDKWAAKLRLPEVILEALKFERAYGGGCVFIGVDDGGRPLTEPLDPSRVKRITHLTAFRGGFDGEVTMWRPYRFAIDPKYGQPEIYQVRNTNVPIAPVPAPGETLPPEAFPKSPSGPTLFYVHESRFLVFDGEPVSREAQQSMRGWGDSIFTRIGEPLAQFEQNWNSVGLLMQEASVWTRGIAGFSKAVAEKGDAARANFLNVARLQNLMRSVARTLYHDATETMARQTVSFGGLDGLLDRCVDRLAAAAGMPVSVLFGNLKGGLGAKEDPSARGWYAKIEARQAARLVPQLERFYRIGFLSREGPTKGKEPAKWSVACAPLLTPNEMEAADIYGKTTTADVALIQAGVVTPEEVAAKRFGGTTYDTGSIVLDLDARRPRAALPSAPTSTQEGAGKSPAPSPTGGPSAPASAPPDANTGPGYTSPIPPIRMMATDPWTGTPASTPSGQGETAEGVPPDTEPSGKADGEVDLTPPKGAREEAQRGLDWRREHGRGGTEVGIARARDIVGGKSLSPETISRMVSFFARHEGDKQGKGWSPGEDGYPSNGRIAWALWGGDAGKAWAEKVAGQLDD